MSGLNPATNKQTCFPFSSMELGISVLCLLFVFIIFVIITAYAVSLRIGAETKSCLHEYTWLSYMSICRFKLCTQ